MSDAAGHMHTVTNVDNRKIAMWTLIGSECFLFGSLIANYMINKNRALQPPYAPDVYDINLTTLSTFVLLMSSVAMVLSLYYHIHRQVGKFRLWTAVVVAFGLFFLGFQAYEFTHFVNIGLGLTTNVFGSSFYLLTGCHGLHVAVGMVWMGSILVYSYVGPQKDKWYNPALLETAGLYWHFVDVVWILIFTIVYLFVYV